MSLREDVSVFHEPGFYIAVAITLVLIGSVLAVAGLIHSPI